MVVLSLIYVVSLIFYVQGFSKGGRPRYARPKTLLIIHDGEIYKAVTTPHLLNYLLLLYIAISSRGKQISYRTSDCLSFLSEIELTALHLLLASAPAGQKGTTFVSDQNPTILEL